MTNQELNEARIIETPPEDGYYHKAYKPFIGRPNLCKQTFECASIKFEWKDVTCPKCLKLK